MKKIVKLSDIAEVTLGQTFRGKAEASDESSGIKLVQIKDVQEGFISSVDSLPYANLGSSKLKVEVRSGDLLLPLRGSRYEASIIEHSSDSEVVTTTNQIAIVRPRVPNVKSMFLLWYFNSSIGRSALRSLNTGTTIPSISRGDLASLSLSLPEIETQDRVVKVYINWLRQKSVLRDMLENGECMTNQLCTGLAVGEIAIDE